MTPNSPNEWYSNRDLFEMIQHLQGEIISLRSDLRATQEAIRRYNNLRADLEGVIMRVHAIEQQAVGRASVGRAVREWGGWIIALVGIGLNLLR
jgi:hypothetical protein